MSLVLERSLRATDPPPPPNGVVTISAAVEMFFGDMRLAPRSKKTYRHGLDKFLRHIEQHEGIDPQTAPVSALASEHVTSFASLISLNFSSAAFLSFATSG